MSTDRILIVTGSRVLADSRKAQDVVVDKIRQAVRTLTPDSIVVMGDAVGPDTWAKEVADNAGIHRWMYGLDGAVDRGPEYGRYPWCIFVEETKREQGRDWPLFRNRVMVAAVREKSKQLQIPAVFLAFVAGWAKTQGTMYTAKLCKYAEFRGKIYKVETPESDNLQEIRC